MEICGVNELSTHITSWDQDHCSPTQLEEILISLKPRKVEFPGYKPHTESGKDSLKVSEKYKQNSSKPSTISVTPEYIDGLEAAINTMATKTSCTGPRRLMPTTQTTTLR